MSKARDLANAADVLDDVSATEIGYLDGVTSAIQTQLDAKTAKSTLTTKGDIYAATAASTPERLAVGNSGDTLVADSSTATGLRYNPAANKNYLINGGFAIAQRGTSFTSTGSANNNDAYTLDRWYILSDGNDAIDVTQDTTTVPTNGEFAIALDVETVNKKFGIATIIENKDVIGLVGNTVTFSFKAKVSATTKLDNVKAAIVAWSGTADTVTSDIISAWGAEGTNPTLIANATYENSPVNLNLTTSYATYSVSAAVDTASTQNLILFIWSDVTDTTAGDFVYIAESKLELGSVATPFVYAGGTFQGELAACQRYLPAVYGLYGVGFSVTVNIARFPAYFVTEARTEPTGISGSASDFSITNVGTPTTITFRHASKNSCTMDFNFTGIVADASYYAQGSGKILFTGCEL
jgi:hypothetical protein